MPVVVLFLLFILGLVLIIIGSDWFVDSTIWIAKVLRIPDLIIGATLVSICTTLPELLVSTGSALNGDTSMALGNAAGSVACNTALILGTAIIFSTPNLYNKKPLKIKSLSVSLTLIMILAVGYFTGFITRGLGIVLLAMTGLFIYYNYSEAKAHRKITEKDTTVDVSRKNIIKSTALFIIGLAFTIAGARLMVVYGLKIAYALNVPSIIIGVTMTALGTSLPELMTSITAIRKKVSAISIGNIFGANILNLTLVLGTSAIIKPIVLTREILTFHLPVILGITLIIVAGTFLAKKKYPRLLGITLLLSYIGYMIATALTIG
ncbi:MAG: calcium/sodium antiporter [Clostridia bacterium]|nr:calcium/sodium antiporter [Clostridia bacterium]